MTEIIGFFIQCVDYRRAVVAVLYHLENPENQTVLVRGRWIRLGWPNRFTVYYGQYYAGEGRQC